MDLDGQLVEADFTDLSSTAIRTADATFSSELFMRVLSAAVGVVLLYDVTSLKSFEYITDQGYANACMCNQYVGEKAVERLREYILVGTKKDVVQGDPEQRQVDKELAAEWAQSQGMKHVELSTHTKTEVDDVAQMLVRSIKSARERTRKEELEERKKKTVRGKFKKACGKSKDKP